MWLPDKFYAVLPFIYAVAGLVTLTKFDTPVGDVSGSLFILTAILVWKMRRDTRQGGVKKRY